MLENATYSSHLSGGLRSHTLEGQFKRDAFGHRRALAADALKPTAQELIKLKVIDAIVKEPFGGAHRSWDETFENTRALLAKHLKELLEIPPKLERKTVRQIQENGRVLRKIVKNR